MKELKYETKDTSRKNLNNKMTKFIISPGMVILIIQFASMLKVNNVFFYAVVILIFDLIYIQVWKNYLKKL